MVVPFKSAFPTNLTILIVWKRRNLHFAKLNRKIITDKIPQTVVEFKDGQKIFCLELDIGLIQLGSIGSKNNAVHIQI